MNAKQTLEAVRDLVSPDVRKEILTAEEAGKVLGLSSRTVWNLIKQGALARVRLPGRKRSCGISRASVESLLPAKDGGVE